MLMLLFGSVGGAQSFFGSALQGVLPTPRPPQTLTCNERNTADLCNQLLDAHLHACGHAAACGAHALQQVAILLVYAALCAAWRSSYADKAFHHTFGSYHTCASTHGPCCSHCSRCATLRSTVRDAGPLSSLLVQARPFRARVAELMTTATYE